MVSQYNIATFRVDVEEDVEHEGDVVGTVCFQHLAATISTVIKEDPSQRLMVTAVSATVGILCDAEFHSDNACLAARIMDAGFTV